MHSRRAKFIAEQITQQLKSVKPTGSNPLNQWPFVTPQMVMNADRRWKEQHTNLQKPANPELSNAQSESLNKAIKAILSDGEATNNCS